MQEIAPKIFIETGFPGVTLGVINWPHGSIMIDSPFRADDVRLWRASQASLSSGVDRLLVNLDAHYDRTLGSRAMECTVVGHERTALAFRDRPINFKPQTSLTGADWELYNNLGAVRWAPPEITFTERLEIQWSNPPLVLEYRPGPSAGSIWVNLMEERILFLGDTIMPNQPPFLATAEISAWLNTLSLLSCPEYHGYILISGRGGVVTHEQVRWQIAYLEAIQKSLQTLTSHRALSAEIENLIPDLLAIIKSLPAERREQYTQRLRWGLQQYFTRQFLPGANEYTED